MRSELDELKDVYSKGYFNQMFYFSDEDQCFSPWGECIFTDLDTDLEFTSVVKFIIYHKSKYCSINIDIENINSQTVEDLIKTSFELDKSLPEDSNWEEELEFALSLGNYYKFSQDKVLADKLLATKTKRLCYCSKTNLVWGIGLGEESLSKEDPRAWNGENMQGFSLEQVRGLL